MSYRTVNETIGHGDVLLAPRAAWLVPAARRMLGYVSSQRVVEFFEWIASPLLFC